MQDENASDTRYFSYDYRNRLTFVERTVGGKGYQMPTRGSEFTYDTSNALVSEIDWLYLDKKWEREANPDTFVHDRGQLYADADSFGRIEVNYLYGPSGAPVARQSADGAHVYLTDRQNSVLQIVDAKGEQVKRVRYDGFQASKANGPLAGDRLAAFGQSYHENSRVQWDHGRWFVPEFGRYLGEGGMSAGMNPYPVHGNTFEMPRPPAQAERPWYEVIARGFVNAISETYYMARDIFHTIGTAAVQLAVWTDKVYLPELKSGAFKGYEEAVRSGDNAAANKIIGRAMLGVLTLGVSEPVLTGIDWARGKGTREEFYESIGGFGFNLATMGMSRGLGRVGRSPRDVPTAPMLEPPAPQLTLGGLARTAGAQAAWAGFDMMFPFARDVGGAAFRSVGQRLGAGVREAWDTGNEGGQSNRLSRLIHNEDGSHKTGLKAWAARQVADWTGTRACFVAGTPIRGEHGPIAVESFRCYEKCGDACDRVWARSEHEPDGEVRLRRVLRTFVRSALVLDLKLAGGIIIGTTGEHPFYARGRGWVPACELRAGDEVRLLEPGWVVVERLEDTGRFETVYNLEIEDDHTYFVGCDQWSFSVWAHNTGGCDAPKLEPVTSEVDVPGMGKLKAYQNLYPGFLDAELHAPHVEGQPRVVIDANTSMEAARQGLHQFAGEVVLFTVTPDGAMQVVRKTVPGGEHHHTNASLGHDVIAAGEAVVTPTGQLEFKNGRTGHYLVKTEQTQTVFDVIRIDNDLHPSQP